MVSKSEIVVGAEIENFTLGYANHGPLRAEELPLRFVESSRADAGQLFVDRVLEGFECHEAILLHNRCDEDNDRKMVQVAVLWESIAGIKR